MFCLRRLRRNAPLKPYGGRFLPSEEGYGPSCYSEPHLSVEARSVSGDDRFGSTLANLHRFYNTRLGLRNQGRFLETGPFRNSVIIDIHTHVVLGDLKEDPRHALDRLLLLADHVGIDRLCMLGNVGRFGIHPAARGVRTINNVTLKLMKHRPDRVFGFCYLNPVNDPAFLDEELERCVAAGMRGIKLWVAVNARDSRLDPIMARAGQLGIPVLHHAWYKTVQKGPTESDPSDIADLARRFPGTNIVMAHLIAAGIRGVLDIQPCHNVSIDTSGSQPQAGIIEYAVKKIGAERIVFGSDMGVRDYASSLAKVEGARISQREHGLILGENAARLLKLKA